MPYLFWMVLPFALWETFVLAPARPARPSQAAPDHVKFPS